VAVGGAHATLHGTSDAPGGNLRPAVDSTFTLFETGQVRPLALSPEGHWLFAVNTPANRLDVFAVAQPAAATPGALTWVRSVPVGLEPVAVAARWETEVWVVNHLSDSVSIVDLRDASAVRVVRTLLVGDEPRDIVFGGPEHDRAFITTAHRGQSSPSFSPMPVCGLLPEDVRAS
jgi:sugar lactone lactonase YvrE